MAAKMWENMPKLPHFIYSCQIKFKISDYICAHYFETYQLSWMLLLKKRKEEGLSKIMAKDHLLSRVVIYVTLCYDKNSTIHR